MSIFNTAIQTLSEVAIQESGVKQPQTADNTLLEDFGEMLDNMPSLTEEEMRFDVRMVPVKESRKYDKYLIEMEDLSRYMITNRISSVKDAIGNILECNGLDGQFMNVALVIDEASIINEIDDLGLNISGQYPAPQPGLGETIYGRPDAMKYIRRIANTKELLDTLYNTYGIPFIKKNYTQVGLLKEETDISSNNNKEDVQIKKSPDDEVLHEKDTDSKSEEKSSNFSNGVDKKDEGITEDLQSTLLANRANKVMSYRDSLNSGNSSTSISSNGSSTFVHQSGSTEGLFGSTSTPSSNSSSPASSTTVAAKPTITTSTPSSSISVANTSSSPQRISGDTPADRIRNQMLNSQKRYKGFQAGDTNAYGSSSNPIDSRNVYVPSKTAATNMQTATSLPQSSVSLKGASNYTGPMHQKSGNIKDRINAILHPSTPSITTEEAKIQYLKDVAAGKYDYQL